jgi:hypothetical protein
LLEYLFELLALPHKCICPTQLPLEHSKLGLSIVGPTKETTASLKWIFK